MGFIVLPGAIAFLTVLEVWADASSVTIANMSKDSLLIEYLLV